MTILLQGAGQQQITAGSTPSEPLLLDLEADTLTAGAVASWADQSGNGYDFTQATGDYQPLAQLIGGYMAVTFDGVDDQMIGGDFADNLESFAIYFVLQPLTSNNPTIIEKGELLGSDHYWEGGGKTFTVRGQTFGDSLIIRSTRYDNVSVPFIATFQKTASATGHAYLDDQNSLEIVSTSGDVITSFSNSENVILSIYNEAFSVHAIRIYSPAPSGDDDTAIKTALATRYGIVYPSAPVFVSATAQANSRTVIVTFSEPSPEPDDTPAWPLGGVSMTFNGNPEVIIDCVIHLDDRRIFEYSITDLLQLGDVLTYAYDAGSGVYIGETGLVVQSIAPQIVTIT